MLKLCMFTHLQKYIGQRVSVDDNKYGILQYVGDVHFADGVWGGIELDEPFGDNDGTINNINYFTCDAYHGLLVPASKIYLVNETAGNHPKLLDCVLAINEPDDIKLQKTKKCDLFSVDYSQHASQSSQKKTLNESYVVSDYRFERDKLSIISEETSDLFSASSLLCSKSENILMDSQNIKSFSADSIDKVGNISQEDFKQNDLAGSDESLGIIPNLLDLSSWETLIIDTEKPYNLNTTVNLFNNDSQNLILGSEKIASEINYVVNSTIVQPNISFACNEEAESPILTERSFPKFASTPKHEINFSDDENISDMRLNLSPEFHLDKSGAEIEKQDISTKNIIEHEENREEIQHESIKEKKQNFEEESSLTSVNINVNIMYSSKNKNEINNLLNVTLTYPTETDKYTDEINFSCDKQIESSPKSFRNDENNEVKIMNRTYTETDKASKIYEVVQDSENANVATKENIIPAYCTVGENNKKEISSFQTTSLVKKEENRQKFERKNFRRSVGSFGESNMSKNNQTDGKVRRNSLSNCTSNLPNTKSIEPKVTKLPQKSHSSLKCPLKLHPNKSSSSDLKKPVSLNYAIKNIPKLSSLKTEEPSINVDLKPASKVRSSTECLLNETINISSLTVDQTKTVVKNRRSSMNLPRSKHSSHPIFDINETPSKSNVKRSSIQLQNQVTENIDKTTAVFKRNLRKALDPAVVSEEKVKKVASLPISRPQVKSSAGNYISSTRTHSTIPVGNKLHSSKITKYCGEANKKEDKINLNETFAFPDQRRTERQSVQARHPDAKAGASAIPISRIPCAPRSNIPLFKSSGEKPSKISSIKRPGSSIQKKPSK